MEENPKPRRRWYRFSLKDLMWSMTLACLGIAAINFVYIFKSSRSAFAFEFLFLYLALSPGPLIGAAIGKLFQSTTKGAVIGLVSWSIFWLLLSFYAMSQIY
jgi:hypothetical protein